MTIPASSGRLRLATRSRNSRATSRLTLPPLAGTLIWWARLPPSLQLLKRYRTSSKSGSSGTFAGASAQMPSGCASAGNAQGIRLGSPSRRIVIPSTFESIRKTGFAA